MGIFDFMNNARRRTIIKEETAFDIAERERLRLQGRQPVRPSFSGVTQKKADTRKKLSEKKKTARDEYLEALASGNKQKQESTFKNYKEIKKQENKYNEIKKEIREEKLKPYKQAIGVMGSLASQFALKRKQGIQKGIFAGNRNQGSNIDFGSDVVNSPFAPKR